MRTAVLFAVVGMVAWGFWALFADLATETLSPEAAMVISYAGGVAVALGYIVAGPGSVSLSGPGVTYALAGGLFSGVGAISYYAALKSGSAAVATTVTGLYFVVAAVLAVLVLGESLSARDVAGVALAVCAVALLAS
ncbi:EamA family transporter [halophilic archaeon]|nr:EamA family transporter [halophilic archaeon]